MRLKLDRILLWIVILCLGWISVISCCKNLTLSKLLSQQQAVMLSEINQRLEEAREASEASYQQRFLDLKNSTDIVISDKDEIIAALTQHVTDLEMEVTRLNQDLETSAPVISLTDEETQLFAKLVYAEVGDQGIKCRMAVATVVINRILSDRFSNNLHDVIYEKSAFSTTSKLSSVTPTDMDYWAIELAIEHYGIFPSNMYYFNCHDFFSWATDYKKIGSEYFSTLGEAEYDS